MSIFGVFKKKCDKVFERKYNLIMIFDKLLFKKLNIIGNSIIRKSSLSSYPKNIGEMNVFLNSTKELIQNNDFSGCVLGNILYSFVSDVEVRDRSVSARTFEDIFSALFNCKPTDASARVNPIIPDKLKIYDLITKNMNWSMTGDLATNEREKTDVWIGDYPISLKTQKGKAYGKNGKILGGKICLKNGTVITNDCNWEINIGGFSFRSLLTGIIDQDSLDKLGDRKKGLGSMCQIRKNMLDPIIANNKKEMFLSRLKEFMPFVYKDDLYVIFKENYRMTFYLIPNSSFVNAFFYKYDKEESSFQKLWQRWENNNLRIGFKELKKTMDQYYLKYYKIQMNLEKVEDNPDFKECEQKISEYLETDFLSRI